MQERECPFPGETRIGRRIRHDLVVHESVFAIVVPEGEQFLCLDHLSFDPLNLVQRDLSYRTDPARCFGWLMSFGAGVDEQYRRAAIYIDKILRGARPVDLPVERRRKFNLVNNMKTAKALGLTIPPSLLQRADQVIE